MTREEAIKILEKSQRHNKVMPDNPNTFFKSSDIPDGIKNTKQRIEALDMAIAALRAQQTTPNEPLTLDELREMDGAPVWVAGINSSHIESGWALVRMAWSFCKMAVGYAFFEQYGKTWLAYRNKPEEGKM